MSEIVEKTECPHSVVVEGYWYARPNFDREEYDRGGFEYDEHEWVDESSRSAYVDIDLHRMKCRLCNHITYYSHAAKLFYEEGIESPGIQGLYHIPT